MFQCVRRFLLFNLNLVKSPILLKYVVVACLFLLPCNKIIAQNLFANADFEQLNKCSEYQQDCASEAWFYIKPSATPLFTPNVVPKPFSGKDLLILPIENIYDGQKKRQFVYTMFCCDMQKGKNYKLSFYVNTADKIFYGLDFYFQKKEFTSSNFSAEAVIPSIHISDSDIVNELGGWNYVEKLYTATGNEKFCLVGNLSKNKFDFSPYQRMNKAGDIFYFIDDIEIKPIIPQPICSEYKENINKLYNQNLRHTELVLVDKEVAVFTDTITIPAVFFETDKSTLKPKFTKLLDSLFLNLNTKNILNIAVEGHTDSKGTSQRNVVLSTERAVAVRNYFLIKMPQLKESIVSTGKASMFPIAENSTELGRSKNRRVEIILTYTNKIE